MKAHPQQVYFSMLNSRLAADEQQLSERAHALRQCIDKVQATAEQKLAHQADVMSALNPYQVLARGYTILQDRDRQIIDLHELAAGQTVRIVGATQAAVCTVDTMEDLLNEKS